MTRPTDLAVARAFYEAKARFEPVAPNYLISYQAVIDRAIEIDAEAGGTDRQTEEVMQIERASDINPVASAADGRAAAPYDRCPTCTAHMPVGKICGGVNCGLKPA